MNSLLSWTKKQLKKAESEKKKLEDEKIRASCRCAALGGKITVFKQVIDFIESHQNIEKKNPDCGDETVELRFK